MIVIHNERTRYRRRWLPRFKWGALLCAMVLIYGSHAPLIALSKVEGRLPYDPSSCVVMIELAKLLVSLATLVTTEGTWALLALPSPYLVAAYAVPATLYALNNNLVVLMQAYMDPSSFQVLSNLKIATTAMLYSLCLGRKLRWSQVFSLGLLMVAGVCHSYSIFDPADVDSAQREAQLHITAWGLFLMLVYCCVSGLAAVYTEKILKSQKLPLSLQNFYLYVFGVLINGLASFSALTSDKSFLEGYSWSVWAIVAGQAVNGLLMSVVLKHGSGITRLFIISCSMLVNALISWAILGLQLTFFFLIPLCMVALATFLYYT
ncbi:probable UDP-sugar transporter protein SLC35A4 [Corythoichthys intestinalis]|uniref:probable UDP-sugar transporter protein SLC35A4 n=1 Tax=Corythoichthys intestinalis TaxID=161448 RepID=UPI0025A52F2D|nr:probable UDP-sugar transporter protein SLC35A4 [Corythoichthys intestinalis]XP_061792657.1 probable UDP-sugar transporter protein SLC35A4 [Nerophis lumbriciformis]